MCNQTSIITVSVMIARSMALAALDAGMFPGVEEGVAAQDA